MRNSLNARVGYNLYRTGMMFRREALRAYSGSGLTPEQWQLSMILAKKGPLTQKQLCDITMQDAPTVSRMLKRMEKKSYVTIKADSRDKRAVKISITKKGLQHAFKTARESEKRIDRLMKGFDEDKKKKLIELLKELRLRFCAQENNGGENEC